MIVATCWQPFDAATHSLQRDAAMTATAQLDLQIYSQTASSTCVSSFMPRNHLRSKMINALAYQEEEEEEITKSSLKPPTKRKMFVKRTISSLLRRNSLVDTVLLVRGGQTNNGGYAWCSSRRTTLHHFSRFVLVLARPFFPYCSKLQIGRRRCRYSLFSRVRALVSPLFFKT